ncbi:unnamed protein product [Prunus armeniaca]
MRSFGVLSCEGVQNSKQLKNTNKGSIVKIKCDLVGGEAIFLRIYVCLAAYKKRFLEGCKPVIEVDACHLKGPYPGQILTAIGVDDLGVTNSLSWAFISDKQNGLISAIAHVLPTAEHRMCVQHLYNNFKATHLGLTLKHMLWVAARATTIPWWEAEMEKIKEEDLEAWKWLVQRPPNNWTESHFHPRYKCDLLLNNLCESFNAAVIDARDNSILTCLESIRMYVTLRMANRRAVCGKWKHPVGPRIFKIIEKKNMGASKSIPRLVGEKIYQWVKGGLPPIRPPFHKRQPGRPKIVRIKEAAEVQVPAPNPPNPLPPGYTAPATKLRRLFIKIRCGACGKEGHNRRGCGRQAEAAQNGNVGQNEVQAADNGNVGQNDSAPTQTNAAPAQTNAAPVQKKDAPTQTYTAPAQIQVNMGRGRGL